MKTKINFSHTFVDTEVNYKGIGVDVSSSGQIWANGAAVGQVIRQTIKQLFGEKVQLKSDYNSVNVWFPTPVSDERFENISTFIEFMFRNGRFDGMTDMYEYNPTGGLRVDYNGINIKFSTNYIFFHNNPKWGTKAYEEWKSAA